MIRTRIERELEKRVPRCVHGLCECTFVRPFSGARNDRNLPRNSEGLVCLGCDTMYVSNGDFYAGMAICVMCHVPFTDRMEEVVVAGRLTAIKQRCENCGRRQITIEMEE